MEPPTFISELVEANSRFDRLELIGEGTYGEVYRGVNKVKQEVAIKVVTNSPNKYDEIQNEMAIFEKFSRHSNMVDYYGTYIYNNENGLPIQIWLIMEYCGGRSVAQLAKTTVYNGGLLSENVIKYILRETLVALKYLHKNKVIHRDIKGPNILLTISGHVKLIDFGVSAQLQTPSERKHSSVGSPFWMAPEVIACEQQLDYSYDNRCDIWSLGITAIELADGDPPLADEHPMRALFKIPRNPPPTVKNPKKWSALFLEFVARAVTKDFETRPSAEMLLEDPFLEGVSNDEISVRKELMSIIHIINKRFALDTDAAAGDQTLLNRQENAKRNIRVLAADDLAKLPRLTDMIILNYLSERYDADQIYTYIGEILIAINPFKDLQIYSEGATLLYQDVQKESLPPHIFMVACTTHQAMIHKRRDQCCVISGESGSGKTVSANYLVHQLAAIGKSSGQGGVNINLVRKILQLNPLLEAFGNAQTAINHNSSRFGKFLELHFTDAGRLVGAKLSEYLLEKSRVVSQPRNERNFHILYYLIAGLDFHNKLEEFELDTAGCHRYLNTDELSLSVCACTSEMQAKFTRIQKCFEDLGFTGEEIQSVYCVLAAILHLGDVDFIVDEEEYHEGEKAKVLNPHKLEIASSLLCVDADALDEALTTHSSVTRGETIVHNNDVAQAMDGRDATSKALYGRLFTWIVHKINTLLRAEDTSETLNRKIGILDIFGFENFSHNSFEQLCINIANEQMQFYYNEYVFVWELEEYAADGVKGLNIQFKNNKPILDLFLQKPVGILALLDEESRFPKASDLTLVEKFQDNIQSEYMCSSKETNTLFTVNHYAGKVVYDATGFLAKNRDTLSIDILQLLRMSTDKTIATLFQSNPKTSGAAPSDQYNAFTDDSTDSRFSSMATSRFQQTVAIHFRQSLRVLLSKVIRCEPHFVRCIRPNTQNKANMFDQDYVMTQLRYTGIIETATIRKQGFSDRIPFKEFVNRYKFVAYYENEDPPATPEVCLQLLRKAEIDEEESWKIGRTKVFLKYWHMEMLSKCKEKYRSNIITIRKFMRNLFVKLQVRKARMRRHEAATKIRATWLGYITRKRYLALLEERRNPKKKKRKTKDIWKKAKHAKAFAQKTEKKESDVTLENTTDEPPKAESESNSQCTPISNDVQEASASTVRDEEEEELEEEEAMQLADIEPRPHFRNLKRLIQGYEEETMSSENSSDTPREIENYDASETLQSAADREGEAALEETRSIIFLSQIDLASKETYDVLNRTSYPVILSMTTKENEGGIAKTKTQKLNHKDRMIAVVDGYGDPLKQKYRQARLHCAEAVETTDELAKSTNQINPPMLGIVEKPPPKDIPVDSDEGEGSERARRNSSFQQRKGGNIQNSFPTFFNLVKGGKSPSPFHKGAGKGGKGGGGLRNYRSRRSSGNDGETYEERSQHFLSLQVSPSTGLPKNRNANMRKSNRSNNTNNNSNNSNNNNINNNSSNNNNITNTNNCTKNNGNEAKPDTSPQFPSSSFDGRSQYPLVSPKPKTYYKGQPPPFVHVHERSEANPTTATPLYNFAGMNLRWTPKTDFYSNANSNINSSILNGDSRSRFSPRSEYSSTTTEPVPVKCSRWSPRRDLNGREYDIPHERIMYDEQPLRDVSDDVMDMDVVNPWEQWYHQGLLKCGKRPPYRDKGGSHDAGHYLDEEYHKTCRKENQPFHMFKPHIPSHYVNSCKEPSGIYNDDANPYKGNGNPYRDNCNPYKDNPCSENPIHPYKEPVNPFKRSMNPYKDNVNLFKDIPNPFKNSTTPYQDDVNPYKDNIQYKENSFGPTMAPRATRGHSPDSVCRQTNKRQLRDSFYSRDDGSSYRTADATDSPTQQKVLQERRLIEQRILEVQAKRNEEKVKVIRKIPPTHSTNTSTATPVYRQHLDPTSAYPASYTKFEEHKAFNYLINDRTLPRNITNHIIQAQKRGNQYRNPKKSPHRDTGTNNQLSNNSNNTLDLPASLSGSISGSVKSETIDTDIQTDQKASTTSGPDVTDTGKESKPGHAHKKTAKKKKKGFNYGFHQENVLRSIKLNKTGRLQELLVK